MTLEGLPRALLQRPPSLPSAGSIGCGRRAPRARRLSYPPCRSRRPVRLESRSAPSNEPAPDDEEVRSVAARAVAEIGHDADTAAGIEGGEAEAAREPVVPLVDHGLISAPGSTHASPPCPSRPLFSRWLDRRLRPRPWRRRLRFRSRIGDRLRGRLRLRIRPRRRRLDHAPGASRVGAQDSTPVGFEISSTTSPACFAFTPWATSACATIPTRRSCSTTGSRRT